jgi:hypothetical protein
MQINARCRQFKETNSVATNWALLNNNDPNQQSYFHSRQLMSPTINSLARHPGHTTQLTISLAARTFCVFFAATAALLLARSLTTSSLNPPSLGQLLMAATSVAVCAIPVSLYTTRQSGRREGQVLRGLVTFSCLSIAISLSIAGANAWALTAVWLATASSVCVCWSAEIRGRIQFLNSSATASPETGSPETGLPETGLPETGLPETGLPETGLPRNAVDTCGDNSRTAEAKELPPPSESSNTLKSLLNAERDYHDDDALGDECEEEFEGLPADVQQQMTRTVEDGVDTLSVLQRVHFEKGERTTNVHISVCPPFAATPTSVEAFLLEDADVEIKIAEKQSYGIRLELRLTGKDEAAFDATVQCIAEADLGN